MAVDMTDHDERTPLLRRGRSCKAGAVTPSDATPLPLRQIAVLLLMRFTEPVSYTVIFPFIAQMLEDVHATPDRRQVGYYAGLIEGLFSFAQMCTVLFWSRLSDRIGRKPVLLTGTCGVMISVLAFGMQKSLAGMLIARSFAGIMNGNVAIIKSVLGEITDQTNQARAFSLLPVTFALGHIIGPMIGGYLANPALQYPSLFGGSAFLHEYPYFLPCAVAATLNAASITLGCLCFKETRVTKLVPMDGTGDALQPPQTDSVPLSRVLSVPIVLVCLSALMLDLCEASFGALVPLYAYTRLQDGGLGLSFNQIGLALSIYGMTAVFVQVVLFPKLHQQYGTLGVYRSTILTQPTRYMCLAALGVVARSAGWGSTTRQVGLTCILALRAIGTMARSASDLLITNSAPSREALASVNGLQQMLSSLAFTFGPIAATTIFAISINEHILGGALVWVVFLLIALVLVGTTVPLAQPKASWNRPPSDIGNDP